MKQIRVVKMNSMGMWYNKHNLVKVFDVVFETPTAYYVLTDDKHPVPIDWIYKSDCEVL